MNYRVHNFLLSLSGMLGAFMGLVVWLVDGAIRRISAGEVSKMPFESIAWRMYVYPLIGGALAWLLVRFLLKARCETCQSKLRLNQLGDSLYLCPGCGARFAVGQTNTRERNSSTQPTPEVDAGGIGAALRQRLYPKSETGAATWKVALVVQGIMALLSVCIRVEGSDWSVDIAGIPLNLSPTWAARCAWIVWALFNVYLLGGIIWSLLAPEDVPTAQLSRGRRKLFITLGVVFLAVSLLAPLLR